MEPNEIKKKTSEKTALAVVVLILAVIGIGALGYLFIAGLTYLICLGFGLEWSWLTALGVWAACIIFRWVLSAAKSSKE